MLRESKKALRARAGRLVFGVLEAQPDARCALDFETPFQLLVATILSAQNTDENVNTVTPRLFARYPEPAAMAAAEPEELQELIHSTGFFRQKTKALLGVSRALVEQHGGEVPDTLAELVALPGVGRKTANLILGVCFGQPGLVVDTHVGRLARRWGCTAEKDPVKVEQALMELVPQAQWTAFSHATIFHGRRVCHARKPLCSACGLAEDCPSREQPGAAKPSRRSRAAGAGLLLAAWLGALACQGDGSDIGPRIPRLENADYRVLVCDDVYRRVTNALVSVEGFAGAAATANQGRAQLPGTPAGQRLVLVEGAAAAARAGDRLGQIAVRAGLPDGGELPFVVYLPDTAPSVGLQLPLGFLGAGGLLDDRTTTGVRLAIPAGTTLSSPSATGSSIVLRSGCLRAHHLPGDLPQPASGVHLWGTGAYIDPPDAGFAPGAQLSLPNDLGLAPGGVADLFRLDPLDGLWRQVGSGQADGSGARIASGSTAVRGGGLYAFAVVVGAASTALLTGRVVDVEGFGVGGALVRAGAARTRTAGDGRFALAPVAAVDAGGAPRTETLDVFGGRDWLPVRAAATVGLTPGSQALADVTLETSRATLVRLQLVNRGRADPLRRLRVSSSEAFTRGLGVGDDEGRICFPDQASDQVLGVLTTRILDLQRVYVAQAFRFVRGGEHHVDLQVFGDEQDWWTGRSSGGSTAVFVVDALGTGPVRFAAVTRDDVPEQGFVGLTRESGVINGAFGNAGQATAAIGSGAAGRSVISAFTLVDVDSARVEIPLLRVRSPRGVFTRHAAVAGSVTGSAGGVTRRRLRATRRITLEDWYDEVFLDRDVMGKGPIDLDPATTGGVDFALGIPQPDGNLAAVEVRPTLGGPRLARLGFVAGVAPVEAGRSSALDVPLDLVADTLFPVADALTNLHASLGVADLSFDLAVELRDGTVVDLARDLTGGIEVLAPSLQLTLPALQGPLQGGRYLLALDAAAATPPASGKTVRQRTFAPLDGGPAPFVRFLDVPDIVAPAPDASVPADGFTVQWTVPVSTLYVIVQLRSDTGSFVRDWSAVLPASFDRFTFRTLPVDSAQPLAAGLTWTLTVTAARVETGPLSQVTDGYRRVLQNFVGLSEAEREVNGFSSTSIQVTTR